MRSRQQAFFAWRSASTERMLRSPMTSLSQPLQAVVTLFEGPLAGVRFGDVDAAGLSKLAIEVSQVATELAEHEAKLASLRQELEQRHEALLTLAQRALAYARIYAEGDQALSAQLSAISLPRAAKARKAGKSAHADESQPAAGAVDESSARAEDVVADEAAEPAKTKPSYARPKIKRKLARAATQSDSA